MAGAGTYEVITCGSSPAAPNNSWHGSSTNDTTLALSSECPPTSEFSGLAAMDRSGASSDTPQGARSEWTFEAPAGTSISAITAYRWLGKRRTNSWTVYG